MEGKFEKRHPPEENLASPDNQESVYNIKNIAEALNILGEKIERAVTESALNVQKRVIGGIRYGAKASEPFVREVSKQVALQHLSEGGVHKDDDPEINRFAKKTARGIRRGVDRASVKLDRTTQKFITDTGSHTLSRRDFLAGLIATTGTLAVPAVRGINGLLKGSENPPVTIERPTDEGKPENINTGIFDSYPWMENVEPHKYFDANNGIDWFRFVPDGKFFDAERAEREESLPGGEIIFRDIGYTFYKVQPGDTVKKIREKLSAYPEFSHLEKLSKRKIESFNIKDKQLERAVWIPLPKVPEEREVSDPQLMKYIVLAIEDILKNGPIEYKGPLKAKIDKYGVRKFAESAFAVGRHESGGNVAGEYSLHRHEPKYNSYSYSHFHILMQDWGLIARKKLGITEGQLVHPVNGAKLFIGFLIEKGFVFNFFPINEANQDDFARLYNGSQHHKNKYVQRINGYIKKGSAIWDELETGIKEANVIVSELETGIDE